MLNAVPGIYLAGDLIGTVLMFFTTNSFVAGENNDLAARLHRVYTDLQRPVWNLRHVQKQEVLG